MKITEKNIDGFISGMAFTPRAVMKFIEVVVSKEESYKKKESKKEDVIVQAIKFTSGLACTYIISSFLHNPGYHETAVISKPFSDKNITVATTTTTSRLPRCIDDYTDLLKHLSATANPGIPYLYDEKTCIDYKVIFPHPNPQDSRVRYCKGEGKTLDSLEYELHYTQPIHRFSKTNSLKNSIKQRLVAECINYFDKVQE